MFRTYFTSYRVVSLRAPGLRSRPYAGWIGIHMAYIRLHCHNNNTCNSEVISVVVGALGTIKKGMVENIKRVSDWRTNGTRDRS